MAEPDPLSDYHGFPQSKTEAQRFVTARYGRRATRPRLLGAGEWSHAYAFTLDDQDAVIRFGRHGEDFLKDQVMAAYSSPDLPIPAVRETGRAAEGYFAVSDRAPGQLLNDLDGVGMRAALPSLLRALDALRALGAPGARGYGIWAPDGTAPVATWAQALLAISQETARIPGWRAALAASPTGTCECGIAPLCRHHHRCKQAQGWSLDQPEPGVLVWCTPHGRTFTTTPSEYPL